MDTAFSQTKRDDSQTKSIATLYLTAYSTRDCSTPAGQLGQRHIIIFFFVWTRRAGAGRGRYCRGACGAAASQRCLADASQRWRWPAPLSQRRLWRQAPRRAGAVWRRRRRRGSIGLAAYDYFFLCLHPQSWRWPAPLSLTQRRLWRQASRRRRQRPRCIQRRSTAYDYLDEDLA